MLLWASAMWAQQPPTSALSQRGTTADGEDNAEAPENPCIDPDDARYCWTIDPLTGLTYAAVPDTSYRALGVRQTMESLAMPITYSGNLMSPHLVQDWFARRHDSHDFIFTQCYSLFERNAGDIIYYNTKLPITTALYATSGSSLQSNDHLKLNFMGNFNSKLGLGSQLDYVYARGEYPNTATKPLDWSSYIYYYGTRYRASLSYTLAKLGNQENGGILDRSYILTPDQYDGNVTDAKNIPTRLLGSWSDNDLWKLHFTHSYELGTYHEEADPADSTATQQRFVSVASIFHAIDVQSYRHRFRQDPHYDATDQGDFYAQHYIDPTQTQDSTLYTSVSTTAGLRLNEGFSRWSQFGLAAFLGYERQSYDLMQDQQQPGFIPENHVSHNVFVGGQLSRHQSSLLTLDATVRLGLTGDKAGDVDANGQLRMALPFGRRITDEDTGRTHRSDSVILMAHAAFTNQQVPYLVNHYFSNHFRWSHDFDPEQHLRVDGSLSYPRWGASVRAGIEHINNLHYFSASDGLPYQYDKQMDIFSLQYRQQLHAGPLHWTGQVLLQTSTDDAVLALPKLTFEMDLCLRFRIAGTLWTELGATGWYYTKYYAPEYMPDTQQFGAQHAIQCGGFPLVNGYINCNLKRLKFFFMYSGLLTDAFSNDRFLMPHYPVQPMRMEYGVVLDLQN